MKTKIFNEIKDVKLNYEPEGVIILGIFGSYARSDAKKNSDIDLLYELNDNFHKKYKGFKAFHRLTTIQDEISQKLSKRVDLVDRSALRSVGKKFILDEVIYV